MSNSLAESAVDSWLARHGLTKHAEALRCEECYDLALILTLQTDDLIKLGIEKVGPRRHFLNAIAQTQYAMSQGVCTC